ncbi:hypothetical protein HMPREF9108_02059 [Leptotrichia sp. oral taxon 225 str. F0581]|nr:hypothetical protein HMPREF9108_02059 [Leptotrichia sp. oral taxon 225 str. F0581]
MQNLLFRSDFMKKIIFALFLLTFSLSFSNSDINILSSKVWNCSSLDNTLRGLIYVKFLTKENEPYIAFSQIDSRAALKTGKVTLELSELNFEVKEDENAIYFTNLNEKTKIFSNYKLAYSFDKKNRPKMSINRISDNKKICNLSIN